MKNTDLLREFINTLFKNKVLIAIVFFSTVATVTVVSFVIQPVYEANAVLLIKFGREYVYQSQVGNSAPYNYFQQDRMLNTEIEILSSQDLLQKVIANIGIDKLYPEIESQPEHKKLEGSLEIFRENLFIQGLDKGNTLRISFQHYNPKIAALSVNSLIEYFKQKRLSIFSNTKTYQFLESQAELYKNNVSEARKSLVEFRQKNNTYSLDEQRTLMLNQLYELNAAYKTSRSKEIEVKNELASLKRRKGIQQSGSLLYSNSSKASRQANQTLIGERIINAETALHSIKAKNSSFVDQRTDIEKQLSKLATLENELKSNINELNIHVENYRNYRKKLEDAHISYEMDRLLITNIRTVQSATVPSKPIKPKKSTNILISIFFGIFASVGLSLLKEYFSQGVSSPLELEKVLSLPVLAIFPYKDI